MEGAMIAIFPPPNTGTFHGDAESGLRVSPNSRDAKSGPDTRSYARERSPLPDSNPG
jgi:hypothetical protein